MEIQQDFRELLELLNKYNVEYIIVGAYALAHYGVPRYTGDIDIFVNPDKNNASKILSALNDFGFGSLNLSSDDFCHPERIIQLGVPPVRIDIITSITGVTWQDAFRNRVPGNYGDLQIFFLGRDEYIANKRATGRRKDLADLEAIGVDSD